MLSSLSIYGSVLNVVKNSQSDNIFAWKMVRRLVLLPYHSTNNFRTNISKALTVSTTPHTATVFSYWYWFCFGVCVLLAQPIGLCRIDTHRYFHHRDAASAHSDSSSALCLIHVICHIEWWWRYLSMDKKLVLPSGNSKQTHTHIVQRTWHYFTLRSLFYLSLSLLFTHSIISSFLCYIHPFSLSLGLFSLHLLPLVACCWIYASKI